MMEVGYTVPVALILALVVVSCASADLEVSGTSKDTVDTKNVSTANLNNLKNDEISKPENNGKSIDTESSKSSKQNSNGDENVAKTEHKGNNQGTGGLNERVGKDTSGSDKNGSSKQLGSNESGKQQKKTTDSSSNKVDQKEKSREGLDAETKKGRLPVRKEGLQGEECDSSSNSCTVAGTIVACLRVPGNESPDLSLLIQNRGKETISVAISAPISVKLEKKQLELQEKENKKVKVSIGKGGIGNTINLKVGNGKCSIDFKDLITRGSLKKSVSSSQFANIKFFIGKSSVWFTFLGFLLVIACVLIFLSFRRKYSAKSTARYEKLDTELAVSGESNKASETSNDGWDNNWDESWEDEEAPRTPPSMPVTPSMSNKGVSSRRLNKEGWKD